ncbi:MAG: hypothetical protein OHK0023_16800 [Anaerolineae bacterium]
MGVSQDAVTKIAEDPITATVCRYIPELKSRKGFDRVRLIHPTISMTNRTMRGSRQGCTSIEGDDPLRRPRYN